ncbi:MAG: hypothetical protein RIQ79_2109, partial [Verrucomicrobiota bacterium]
MPDSTPEPKRRPLKNLPPDRFQPRMWLIWTALLAAVVAVLYLSPPKTGGQASLGIQEVMTLAGTGKIKTGMIRDSGDGRDWRILTGETVDGALGKAT